MNFGEIRGEKIRSMSRRRGSRAIDVMTLKRVRSNHSRYGTTPTNGGLYWLREGEGGEAACSRPTRISTDTSFGFRSGAALDVDDDDNIECREMQMRRATVLWELLMRQAESKEQAQRKDGGGEEEGERGKEEEWGEYTSSV